MQKNGLVSTNEIYLFLFLLATYSSCAHITTKRPAHDPELSEEKYILLTDFSISREQLIDSPKDKISSILKEINYGTVHEESRVYNGYKIKTKFFDHDVESLIDYAVIRISLIFFIYEEPMSIKVKYALAWSPKQGQKWTYNESDKSEIQQYKKDFEQKLRNLLAIKFNR